MESNDRRGENEEGIEPASVKKTGRRAIDEANMSVRVAVRARPLVDKEKSEGGQMCVSVQSDGQQILVGQKAFTFDHTFSPDIGQSEVYDSCVANLVEAIFNGYNATVFAYGQTGSGKTYTMGSCNNVDIDRDQVGIIPRALQDIFFKIKERNASWEVSLKVSFMEIHNEDIRDLLDPLSAASQNKAISIREDPSGGVAVVGVREFEARTYDDLMHYLEKGSLSRTTASTLMNDSSSRSHAIFSLVMEQHRRAPEGAAGGEGAGDADGAVSEYMSAKFHFVDLAGSERAKRTGAVGDRLREGISINCGLLALGNVISALGDPQKRSASAHVPYRDSKLTRMLQNSLGGNSRTLMIACVSPAASNFEETLNTLKYANRAKNIKNKPVVNRDLSSNTLAQLHSRIASLEERLSRCTCGGGGDGTTAATPGSARAGVNTSFSTPTALPTLAQDVPDIELYKEHNKVFKEKNNMLKAALQTTLAELQVIAASQATTPAQSGGVTPVFDDDKLSKLQEGLSSFEQSLRARLKTVGVTPSKRTPRRSSRAFREPTPGVEGVVEEGSPPNSGDDDEDEDDEDDDEGEDDVVASLLEQLKDAGSDQAQDEEAREHEERQRRMHGELTDLDSNIVEKERLLADLLRSREQFQALRQTYEQKLQEMEESVRHTEAAKERLLAELESATKTKPASDQERIKEKLHKLERELANYKSKQREYEALRKINSRNDDQVLSLRSELERFKQFKVALQKKVKEDTRIFKEQQENRDRHIRQLKKQASKDTQQKKVLQVEKDRAEGILRRREQQLVSYKTKLKEADRQFALLAQRLRSQKAARVPLSQRTTASNRSTTTVPSKPPPTTEKDGSDFLAAEVERALARRRAKAVIDEEKQARDLLDMELRECAAAQQSYLTRLKNGEKTDQDDLVEFEEHMDYLAAEIEYKETVIRTARADLVAGPAGSSAFLSKLDAASNEECRNLLKTHFDRIVELRETVITHEAKYNKVNALHQEALTQLQDLHKSMRAISQEHEAKVTQIQSDHEQRVLFLLQQINASKTAPTANTEGDTPSAASEWEEMLAYRQEEIDILNNQGDQLQSKLEEANKMIQEQTAEITELRAQVMEKAAQIEKHASREKQLEEENLKLPAVVQSFPEDLLPGAVLQKLNALWDEMGLSSKERIVEKESVTKEFEGVSQGLLRRNVEKRDMLRAKAMSMQQEILSLQVALDETVSRSIQDALGLSSLCTRVTAFDVLLNNLRTKKNQLVDKFSTLHTRLHALWDELGPDYPRVAALEDLSDNFSVERQTQYEKAIKAATLMKAERRSQLAKYVEEISALWAQLALWPHESSDDDGSIDAAILNHGEGLNCHTSTIETLKRRHEALVAQKEANRARIAEIRNLLATMYWPALETAKDISDGFLNKHSGVTAMVVEVHEREIQNCEEMLKHKLPEVSNEVHALWDELHESESHRQAFVDRIQGMSGLDTCKAYVEERNSLQEKVSTIAPLHTMFNEWKRMYEDRVAFESKAQNEPNRLKGNSVHLLKESHLRKQFSNDFLALHETLKLKLDKWEHEHGESLLSEGQRISNILKEYDASGSSHGQLLSLRGPPALKTTTTTDDTANGAGKPPLSSTPRSSNALGPVKARLAQSHLGGSTTAPSSSSTSRTSGSGTPTSSGAPSPRLPASATTDSGAPSPRPASAGGGHPPARVPSPSRRPASASGGNNPPVGGPSPSPRNPSAAGGAQPVGGPSPSPRTAVPRVPFTSATRKVPRTDTGAARKGSSTPR